MNAILTRKKIWIAVLLSCLSLLAKAQQPLEQVTTKKLTVINSFKFTPGNQAYGKILKTDAQGNVYLDTANNATIIIPPGSPIDSITFNGNTFCWYEDTLSHCFDFNRAYTSVVANADSTYYYAYNNGVLIDSFPTFLSAIRIYVNTDSSQYYISKNGTVIDSFPVIHSSGSVYTYRWSVIDSLSTPPVTPSEGDIYLVGTSPTGTWVGHANQIATYSGGSYTYATATAGNLLYNSTLGIVDKFNGTSWVRISRPANFNWNLSGNVLGTGINKLGSIDNKAWDIMTFYKPVISFLNNANLDVVLRKSMFVDTSWSGGNPNDADSKSISFYGGSLRQVKGSLGVDGSGTGGTMVVTGTTQLRLLSPEIALYTNAIQAYLGALTIGWNSTNSGLVLKNIYTQYSGNQFELQRQSYFNNTLRSFKIRFDGISKIGDSLATNYNSSAALEIESNNKGMLIPRMTQAVRNEITGDITGSITNAGTGYTPGTYIAGFTGNTGTGSVLNITVGVGGTVTAVIILDKGRGYTAGTASAPLPAGSGFVYTISAVAVPATGLLIYQTDNTPGFYYYNGSAWTAIGSGGGSQTTTLEFITAAAAQTVFAFTAVPSTFSDYIISRNGIPQEPTVQFTVSGNNVTIPGAQAGDKIRYHRIK